MESTPLIDRAGPADREDQVENAKGAGI